MEYKYTTFDKLKNGDEFFLCGMRMVKYDNWSAKTIIGTNCVVQTEDVKRFNDLPIGTKFRIPNRIYSQNTYMKVPPSLQVRGVAVNSIVVDGHNNDLGCYNSQEGNPIVEIVE